jgi:hypothetical protein
MKKRTLHLLSLALFFTTLAACKKNDSENSIAAPDEFIEYTVNSTTTFLSKPRDSVIMGFQYLGSMINTQVFPIQGSNSSNQSAAISIVENISSRQHSATLVIKQQIPVQKFRTYDYYTVTISEAKPSSYFAGTFSGTIYDSATNNAYPFNCRFRVKYSY